MKVKVSEATGPVLNWMVARCEGFTEFKFWFTGVVTTRWPNGITQTHNYSESWAQGGPIIEREKIGSMSASTAPWVACISPAGEKPKVIYGPNPPHRSHALLRD